VMRVTVFDHPHHPGHVPFWSWYDAKVVLRLFFDHCLGTARLSDGHLRVLQRGQAKSKVDRAGLW
jgi:hypothetical protein